jgi:DNA-3-methyladenine glycosylase
LNYGIHSLVNAVTEPVGSPAAVLVRALEPLEGVALMAKRRGAPGAIRDVDLCRGPGNLSRALGITLRHNGGDLCVGTLSIEDRGHAPGPVAWGPRIGIRRGADRPWRCAVIGHPSVSGTRVPPVPRATIRIRG